MKMRRCEDEKMFYRPPLLEEPCAQTRSGKSATSIIEGSLKVKLPTIWTDEKQRWEESERREE